MEYMQMTLNEWLEMKQSLERELSNLKTGFVRVGYVLRKIDDSRGYEQDGYKSVAEFAKAEYGLDASTVSRFMAINERFSLDGYSERLDPKYIGFRQSIMGEMLGLPDQDIELVRPETSRQDVRELKQFNRQEPEKGVADDIRELLENYFRDNREELNRLYHGKIIPTKAVMNPSGNKVYRKGMFMMFLYNDQVKLKKFGGKTATYNWDEFRGLIDEVFGDSAGPDTYANYFGVAVKTEQIEPEEPKKETQRSTVPDPEPEKKPAPKKPKKEPEPELDEDMPAEAEEVAEAEGADTIAPAQIMPEPEAPHAEEAPKGPEIPKEKMSEYIQELGNARGMLDQIEEDFEAGRWHMLSGRLIKLGFIVDKLKAIKKLAKDSESQE